MSDETNETGGGKTPAEGAEGSENGAGKSRRFFKRRPTLPAVAAETTAKADQVPTDELAEPIVEPEPTPEKEAEEGPVAEPVMAAAAEPEQEPEGEKALAAVPPAGDRTVAWVVGVVGLLLLVAAGAVLAIVLSGGSSSAVAKVNGDQVTKGDYQTMLLEAQGAFKAQKKAFPKATSTQFTQVKGQIVGFLVQGVELQQELGKLGVKQVGDADVAARLAQIKKQLGGEQKFQAFLKQRGIPLAAARLEIRLQLLQERTYAKVTGKISVSDAEAQAYYQKNTSQFKQPASRTVRHILVKTQALALQIESQLKSGGDFAKLAKKYSIDSGTKNQGGKLTISQGQTVPQFDKAAFALPTGATSPPVKSQFGWHVIQALTPVKPAHQQTFAEVKKQILQTLKQQQKSAAWTAFQQKVTKDYDCKVDYGNGYAPPGAVICKNGKPTSTVPQLPTQTAPVQTAPAQTVPQTTTGSK